MRRLATLALTCFLTACGDGEPLLPADAVLPDGGRYRGAVVDGLLQGEGRIDYPNGSSFLGLFKDGQWHGRGVWQGANGDRYEGEFKQGLFDGQGRFSYATGGVYEGQFEQGSLNGKGSYSEAGLSYDGEFKDGLYHGTGKLESADGVIYEGQFDVGQPNGQGARSDASGAFSGSFALGSLNGDGVYRGIDGAHYVGQFLDDQFHGNGRYEDAIGNVWKGSFEHGELSGSGEYVGMDGTHYSGQFKRWQYRGQGDLRQPDGSHYSGRFRAGQYDGPGTLTQPDGSQQSGIWKSGRLLHDPAGNRLPDPLELGLLRQGTLLADALDAVPASTPAAELYTLTVAGDGQQSVFMREVDYVDKLMRERFAAHGQITLVNHRDHLADRPLATRENMARAVSRMAEQSGSEDLIFIYLTSHGSADHQLALTQPRLALEDLPATDLAALLAPLAERNKIVVISACYSGGFIEPLKSPNTLVITAARADRVSFGCSEENDFTYFGRALFAEALQKNPDIEQAFAMAQVGVAEREQADDYQASEPQIWAPEQVVEHWRALIRQLPASTD